MSEVYRPTWVDVDLDAIRDNARILKPETAELMAVVKANGYGHGDVEVARAAIDAGATWLGVALVEEGLELRDAGIEAPILVLSELPAGSEAVALAHRLTPTLYSDAGLERLSAAARGSVPVHVKIDTGMHRVGVWPPEDAPAFARRVQDAGLEVEGLFTHFARSEEDEVTTKEQLGRFLEAADAVRSAGVHPTAACTRRTRAPRSCTPIPSRPGSDRGSRSTGSNPRPESALISVCGRRSPGGAR